MIGETAEIRRDVRRLKHVHRCAPGNDATPPVGFQKCRPEGRLSPAKSNCPDGTLSLVPDAIWIEAGVVCLLATDRRRCSEQRGQALLQFGRHVLGHSSSAGLRRNKRLGHNSPDRFVVEQEFPNGIDQPVKPYLGAMSWSFIDVGRVRQQTRRFDDFADTENTPRIAEPGRSGPPQAILWVTRR
jgi:hypothetical protein